MSPRDSAVTLARHSIKATAAGIDLARRPAPGVTILIYHRVGAGSGGQMDLSPAVFDEQLRWLRANREVISLDEALDRIAPGVPASVHRGGNGLSESAVDSGAAVVLTFDDGTTDWVDHVLPAIEAHRAPATFYVATSFVEDQSPLPGGGEPITWSGLRDLASSDLVTIGSHTHRHMLLDRLAEAEIAAELDRSLELLGERLGIAARHFAYPKAVAGSPEAEQAVRERFTSAVLAGTRPNPAGTDPHRLWRSPIQAADTPAWFRRKARGGMRGEDDLRRLANRVRYRKLES